MQRLLAEWTCQVSPEKNIIAPMKRLNKALAAAGIASRRKAEIEIFGGRVKVNGRVVYTPQTLIDWKRDEILWNDQLIRKEEKKIYLLLNKPKGWICSHAGKKGEKVVIDLFASLDQRLFTVGRLDRDTTGLLLVTNDGHFAQEVIHPKSNLTKEYLVKTKGEVTSDHLIEMGKGARIERQWIKPVRVKKVRRGTVKIAVKEGKKREVRHLVEGVGLPIFSLSRIRIGGLILGDLKEGKWRVLKEGEKWSIFS